MKIHNNHTIKISDLIRVNLCNSREFAIKSAEGGLEYKDAKNPARLNVVRAGVDKMDCPFERASVYLMKGISVFACKGKPLGS
jgi:hypothetical protein